MRYFLDISYLGTAFHGWQVQKNAHSVQVEINQALSTLLRKETECLGSGRTDTGVHARQQIAHFDSEKKIDTGNFFLRLNKLLPREIAINKIIEVTPGAHARFDALSRGYEYHIIQIKDPFRHGQAYFFPRKLDQEAINEGMRLLKTWKNFQAFSKVHTDVNHFDCEIYHMEWKQTNDSHLFSVRANRFLRGMVRAMVGTLLEVGQNRVNVAELKQILESRDRSAAGRSVPAEGLHLTEVKYPDTIYLET